MSSFVWLLLSLLSVAGEVCSFQTTPAPPIFIITPQSRLPTVIQQYNRQLAGLRSNSQSEFEVIAKSRPTSTDVSSIQKKDSKWDSFKRSIYGTVDVVRRVPLPGRPRYDSLSRVANRKSPVIDVYSANQPPVTLDVISPPPTPPQVTETPGERLLRQYDSTAITTTRNYNNNKRSEVVQQQISYKDNLYQSDFRKKFDSVKDGFYGGIDFVFQRKKTSSRSVGLSESNRIRPMARTSSNINDSTAIVLPYVKNLESRNPITRFRANQSLASAERRLEKLEKQKEQRATFEKTKRAVYNAVDAIQTVGNVVIAIPVQTTNAVVSIPTKVIQTKDVIQDSIDDARDFIEDVQVSYQEATRISQEVANDIQNLPQTVETKIENTKSSIRETKESVESTIQKVQDLVFDAKVLAGIEKPKPKPPPPRQPKPMSQMALETTGSVAWTVTKGSAKIFASGVKLLWKTATTTKPKDEEEEVVVVAKQPKKDEEAFIGQSLKTMTVEKPPTPTAVKPSPPRVSQVATTTTNVEEMTLANIDTNLDKEVTEALQLATAALEKEDAKTGRKEEEEEEETEEIDEAVRLAKEAAVQAMKDVVELQDMIRDRGIADDDDDNVSK